LKAATGLIADQWFQHPSARIDVLAVTGTNGKTTTAWWLAHALAQVKLQERSGCALVGTLGQRKDHHGLVAGACAGPGE
ncbi:Mur ligase family protein, partial [Klebsiella variicola]|uniref:Mur ligase family protein n=1 Tax=Klebsiella variicola TaxID=244366 RepID=UPI00272FA596